MPQSFRLRPRFVLVGSSHCSSGNGGPPPPFTRSSIISCIVLSFIMCRERKNAQHGISETNKVCMAVNLMRKFHLHIDFTLIRFNWRLSSHVLTYREVNGWCNKKNSFQSINKRIWRQRCNLIRIFQHIFKVEHNLKRHEVAVDLCEMNSYYVYMSY